MNYFKHFYLCGFLMALLLCSLVKANTIRLQERIPRNSQQIPITVTVRSIRDLRVKEGQNVRIGQLLALRPIEPQAPARYIPKNHEREVQKQKAKLEKVKLIVKEEGLPEIMIKHEEAKLRDLEFEASEYRKGAVDPRTPQETTYNSPVNGIVKRIIPTGGSDGRLNVEILIEQLN
ncbi:MAG: hypothetical protein SFU25_08985 [Candidatus Caenarcaniphilales bacterium]|nr:hypothetical protein [Candidatus Caenarcaniphilales bacterium]